MLVYGDPEFSIRGTEAWAALERLRVRAEEGGCAEAREFLVACGQVEQALADAELPSAPIAKATDQAAEYLLDRLEGRSAASRLSLPGLPTEALRVKIPEGYAFYALYPEQHLRAAALWAKGRQPGPVNVIGLRSIGTSLSALVAAHLRRAGWNVCRQTVRPGGHPFQRTVRLQPTIPGPAIVVDEGPGLSGSSLASVALAARASALADISFFPGHAGSPGSAASPEILQLWNEIPRFVSPLLPEIAEELKTKSATLLNSKIREMEDASSGQWRERFGVPDLPAAPRFERPKFLLLSHSGEAILWKFAGLAAGEKLQPLAEAATHRQRRLAELGWTAPPLSVHNGFVATRWIDGLPLRPVDLDSGMIERLAHWLLAAARPPDGRPPEIGFERLRSMALRNLGHASGFEAGPPSAGLPTAGDGRPGPHEWILERGGRIVRTDVWGHECDHTWVGAQPIHWDIAGTILHWQMDEEAAAKLLRKLAQSGLAVAAAELRPYFTAWRAFQAGLGASQAIEAAS